MVEEYEQINKDIAIRAEYVASVARKAFDETAYIPDYFDCCMEYADSFDRLEVNPFHSYVELYWEEPVPYEDYSMYSRLRLPAKLFDNGAWDELYDYFEGLAKECEEYEHKKELRNTLMQISDMKNLYGDIDYVTLVCDALNGEDVDKLVEEYT